MRTLAIECATEACSVALFDGGAAIGSDHRILGRGHAEHLVPMIAALPERGRAERILVSLGPGSFTGVRIGIATARALGWAWNADVWGYPTLALVAAITAFAAPDEPVAACMTGGHGEWFVQGFGPCLAPLHDAQSLPPAAAVHVIDAERVGGTQAEAFVALRGSGTATALHPDARHALQVPQALLSAEPRPLYGRAPDARPPA